MNTDFRGWKRVKRGMRGPLLDAKKDFQIKFFHKAFSEV